MSVRELVEIDRIPLRIIRVIPLTRSRDLLRMGENSAYLKASNLTPFDDQKGIVMRAIFVALPVILFLGAYEVARGEPANVSGGVSCTENAVGTVIGSFTIQIIGEIDATTVDKVSSLFGELHEADANGGVGIPRDPGRPYSGPSMSQRRVGNSPQAGRVRGNSVRCPVYGVGYEINSLGGDVSAARPKFSPRKIRGGLVR